MYLREVTSPSAEWPVPEGADRYLSYQGVPIAFQDGVDSSCWESVPAGAAGVKHVAVHDPQRSRYVIKPLP